MTDERSRIGRKHAKVVRKKAGSWQKGGFGPIEFLGGAVMVSLIGAAAVVVYRSYYSTEHPAPVTRVNPPEKVVPKTVERKSKEVTITEDPVKVLEYIVNKLNAKPTGKTMLLNNEVYPVYIYTDKQRGEILVIPASVRGQGVCNDGLYLAQPIPHTYLNGVIMITHINKI